MWTIHKYPLQMTRKQTIHVPWVTDVLTAQFQRGVLQLWARVDTTTEYRDRVICIYGTGHPLPDQPGFYVATAQDGSFVWHVFDEGFVDRT